MVTVRRTDSSNPDFIALVNALNVELAERDGAAHSFYAQFNTLEKIKHVVVAYADTRAVGCGAIREYAAGAMEIKRMYTRVEDRGKGIASLVLAELEAWAHELGYGRCILETGKQQPEAIGLYQKHGYQLIPNYGPYAGVENSVCFEKSLHPAAK